MPLSLNLVKRFVLSTSMCSSKGERASESMGKFSFRKNGKLCLKTGYSLSSSTNQDRKSMPVLKNRAKVRCSDGSLIAIASCQYPLGTYKTSPAESLQRSMSSLSGGGTVPCDF